ncbi:MAG: hypothetical protein ACWA5X_06545 [bacterium]
MSHTEQLLKLLDQLIPLVDGLADKLRVLLWALLGILLWFGFYLLHLKGWGWGTAAIVAIIVVIPLLILMRIYVALRGIQELPDTLDEVSDDMQLAWKQSTSGKRGAMNVISQARNLYQVRGLLGGAGDMIGQYVNFGVLVNPLFLLLGVLALLATLILAVISIVTLLTAVL